MLRPAGNSVTKPGPADSVTVTLSASAMESPGTPAGSASVTLLAAPSLAPERESYRRVGVRGTNLPDALELAGTNAPTTSTITGDGIDVKTRNVPPESTRVIELFARIWLARKLTFETVGRA